MTTDKALVLQCVHCDEQRMYQVHAASIRLFSHGLMTLEYFCLECRRYNLVQLHEVFARMLTEMGVPSTLVAVPMEVMEHDPKRPPITEALVRNWEAMSLPYLNEVAFRELQQ